MTVAEKEIANFMMEMIVEVDVEIRKWAGAEVRSVEGAENSRSSEDFSALYNSSST